MLLGLGGINNVLFSVGILVCTIPPAPKASLLELERIDLVVVSLISEVEGIDLAIVSLIAAGV